MAKGCLAALFGIGLNAPASGGPSAAGNARPRPTNGGMTEGDVHSGPGGYEGMGYSGGYAADYRSENKTEPTEAEAAEDYGFEEGEA